MKIRKILFIISLLLMLLVAGCDYQGTYDVKTIDTSECIFENGEFTYDGTAKSLELNNIPEDCTVTYENNEQVESGSYTVKAVIENKIGKTASLEATLVINSAQGVIQAASEQTLVLGTKVVSAQYKLNNEEQEVVSNIRNRFNDYGTYEIVFSAEASKNYLAAEDVVVKVNVVNNAYGLTFYSQTFDVDGSEKSLIVEGQIPEGMKVEYTGNVQKEQGVYPVTANLIKESDSTVVVSMRALMTLDYPKNEEFEDYMDELLVLLFEGDELSINFFFENAKNYGIGEYEASFPTASLEWSDDDQEVEDLINTLTAFEEQNLSFEEQDCLKIVKDYFVSNLEYNENMSYMSNQYLGSYLGYQANYPLELVEYKFRNERDITNYLDILRTSEEAFKSYFEFAKLQADKGFGMTDYVIDEVVSQCEEFVKEGDNHYLISTFNDKIDKVSFLTEEQTSQYKADNKELVTNNLYKAYGYIAENLGSLKGKATNEGGLANYGADGVEYYRLMLGQDVGYYNINLEEVVAYIDGKLEIADKAVTRAINNASKLGGNSYNRFVGIVTDETNSYPFSELSDEELVAYFQEAAKAFVPDIEEMPIININMVPTSLEENFSPACYFISPIDSTKVESIYINGKYADDRNYIFTTLAHEGYPGHLYQNVFTKSLDINDVRRVLTCGGYKEGWATYMELNAYSMIEGWDSDIQAVSIEYFKANDLYNAYLNSRLDLGIHYQGWTPEQAANWLNEILDTDAYNVEKVMPFYNQISEVPTNSLKYNYSYAKLDDFHSLAKSELGVFFNEVKFNTELLRYGALPLEMLEEKVNEFIANQKFLYDIK